METEIKIPYTWTFFQEINGLLQRVEHVNPFQDDRWDDLVTQHPNGWLCHLSGWKRLLESSFPHMRGYYFALRNSSADILAGLPIFLVKSHFLGNRLVSIPFATISDPLIANRQELELLFNALIRTFQDQKYSHLEIRTHLANLQSSQEQFCEQRFYKQHFLDLSIGPEHLKKTFDRSCVRQKIERAHRRQLKLKLAETENDLRIFYRLYFGTRKRLALPAQPYRFFKNLWTLFAPRDQIQVLLAVKSGQVIAGLLLFKFKNRVSAEFAATSAEFKDDCPNHFLFWEAIQLAYQSGYDIFDFGRTSPKNTGLMNFKKRWGTQVIDLPQYFYPNTNGNKSENFENSVSYQLIRKISNKMPNFIFKQFGNFCYRHLG